MTTDPREALAAWTIRGPWAIRPTVTGTNNRSFVVESPTGFYFLRCSPSAGDLARVHHEHELLHRLHDAALSFAAPHPIETESGETYLIRDGVAVSLFPIIGGHHPEAGNLTHAAACGEALGELDAALATIDLGPTPPGIPQYDDLLDAGPLIDEGLALLDRAPDAAAIQPRLRARLDELVAIIPNLRDTLPAQLIHGDYYRNNVLMEGDRVSGVLDFEFSAPGPRAMEFAVAIRGFSYADWGADPFWRVVEALATGYRRRVPLTPAEIAALPALLLLREATSWLHRVGRYRQGLATPEDIADRARDFLRLDDHLRTHGAELVRWVERTTPRS